ncbi:MAG: VWA domain-containing protein [Planctomycetes bacterium]|nr:VWA domain-containing protein [Planctomycetota bacterium]
MAKDCPPKNVCLVVDVSDSMGQEGKLRQIKAAVTESLRHYMAGDVFSLVAFNERARLVVPPTQLEPGAGDMDALLRSTVPRLMSSPLSVGKLVSGSAPMEQTIHDFVKAIESLRPGGQTNLAAALQLATRTLQTTVAQRELLRNPRAINRILLFTDGMHNAKRATPDVLARFHAQAHELVAQGLSISAFGVGRAGFDERLLCELVRPGLKHSGRYYYTRDSKRVRELLWDDLMTTPMLEDALLTVELSEGVTAPDPGPFRVAPGSPTRLWLNLGTLSTEETRRVTLELRPSGRGRGVTTRVKLVYRDPGGRWRVEEAALSASSALANAHPMARAANEELLLQDVRAAFLRGVAFLDREDNQGAADQLQAALRRLPR